MRDKAKDLKSNAFEGKMFKTSRVGPRKMFNATKEAFKKIIAEEIKKRT